MKARNLVIYNEDKEVLQELQEQHTMLGFDTQLEDGKLIVFALSRWAMSRKQKKQAQRRNRKSLTRK